MCSGSTTALPEQNFARPAILRPCAHFARIEPAEWGSSEDVDKTDVKVTGSGSSVSIESDYTDVATRITWFGVSRNLPLVHYTISMPATARLSVNDHNANVRVTGLRNDLRVSTHNGSVDVTDLDIGWARPSQARGLVR